jgi:hypothetical protein
MAILTRTALLAGLLILSTACVRSPTMVDFTEPSIAVHAVLAAGGDSATVLITRPSFTGPSLEQIRGSPVTDAQVRLVHNADTVALGFNIAAGSYSARVPNGVQAGVTYELLVTVPGQAPIRGTTRVPLALQILEPSPSADPPVLQLAQSSTGLRTRWSTTETGLVELRLAMDRSDCDANIETPGRVYTVIGIGVERVWLWGTDTLTVAPASVRCPEALVGRYTARFVVTVYEASFTAYMKELFRGSMLQQASFGVTGANGVFGAASTVAIPVVLEVQ